MDKRINEAIWIENRQCWQIKIQREGVRKTFTSYDKTKKGKIKAERKADEWIAAKGASNNHKLNDIFEKFLSEIESTTSIVNYKRYKSIYKVWIYPDLKNKRLDKITQQNWQDIINKAVKQGKAKKTCQNIRATISTFIKYCRKNKIEVESVEFVTISKKAYTKEKNILQPKDIKILFENDTVILNRREQKEFYIYVFRFILLTGMRRGEVCGLQWDDIQNGYLMVKRSVNDIGQITKGKNENARRIVALSKYAVQVLNEQKEMLNNRNIESKWTFPNQIGEMIYPHHLIKVWNRYKKQYGIKSTIHEMRHTFISLSKDVPKELLKSHVGHSDSMDTFGIYGHNVDGEHIKIANMFDNIFKDIIE